MKQATGWSFCIKPTICVGHKAVVIIVFSIYFKKYSTVAAASTINKYLFTVFTSQYRHLGPPYGTYNTSNYKVLLPTLRQTLLHRQYLYL